MMLSATDSARVLRQDFLSFAHWAFMDLNPETPLLLGPHLEVIATKLEACRQGRIRRLAIVLPPRQLKSHMASVAFPAWYLGHHPARHVICASYGQELADKMARDCRRLMNSAWYKALFSTRLAERQAAHDFTTTRQGSRMSTSVGGVLTGRGADILILDDPIKPDEALSEARRKSVNEWYDHTLLSRLNDKATGCIIIIMQRLHQADLVGHVLEQEPWEVLSFPAIAEEDQEYLIDTPVSKRVFKRLAGTALHPDREPLAVLKSIRETIGAYNFSAQYQQNPTPLGGAIVKTHWLKYYERAERPEKFSYVLQSWDTANKASELSDFSVCTTWGVFDGHYYLLDVYRERLDYPTLKRKARELALLHRPHTLLIEDKASGTQLIQELKNSGVSGVSGYQPPPSTDKIIRLHAQTSVFEAGRILLPKQAAWLSAYVTELTSFPGSRYDDQVDSTTQALDFLNNHCSFERIRRYLENVPTLYARTLHRY